MKQTPFTSAQLEALDVDRRNVDTCVVAGPGSGKTTVLVEYFRRLVEADVDPLRILAITFTEKAAGNMRKKLAEAFHGSSAIRAKLERAWVSTVHGFCGRLLHENAVFAGVDPDFYVADARESWRLQQEAIAGAVEGLFADHPDGVRALIRGLSSPEFEQAALSAYDAMRGAGVRVEDLANYSQPAAGPDADNVAPTVKALADEPADGWSHAQREHLNQILESAGRIINARTPLDALAEIEVFPANLTKCKRGAAATELVRRLRDTELKDLQYSLITAHYSAERRLLLDFLSRFDRLYRERKRQAGALDFADLEEYAARLLETSPEVRARIQSQFDHILMDEFQDTNGQQAKLLELLRLPDRFYAVGDINQSIFGFRHANPEEFERYRDEVEAKLGRLVDLVSNFRSRADILMAVETATGGLPGIVPRRLIAERKFDEEQPVSVECFACTAKPVGAALKVEAEWVARRALELGAPWSGIAVLVRNTEVIAAFTAAFESAGVPYLVNRGRGFYDSREVADLMSLLRVIANPNDQIAMATVLCSPLVGLSAEELLDVFKPRGLAITDETPARNDALHRFQARLKEWRARREYVTFDRLLIAALDECGYQPESGARGAAAIDKFLAMAREASARMSLDEFVEELALLRDANPREPDAAPADEADAVQIMTVHSAKGLEFPTVFVSGMHKGVDTEPPVIAFSRKTGLGARWRNPASRKEKDDLFQHALREERKAHETDESHRLLYVAMTRAENRLILTFSAPGGKPANWAAIMAGQLGLDLSGDHDETVTRSAPDGREWQLRTVCAGAPASTAATFAAGAAASSANGVELLDAPAVSGQCDGNATVTALTAFARCPRAYYLRHYLGFTPESKGGPSEGLSAAELGSQVHALLAGETVPDADPQATKLADVFVRGPLGRRAARAGRIEREFDFLMSVEDLVIRGQIDLWFEEGGELTLVDYKTDAVTRAEAPERAREYEFQVRLYAMAVERLTGRAPDHAWLHFLRPDTAVEVDLSPSLLGSPDELVREFQEAQEKLDFPMRTGERCARCPFAGDLCPAAV